MKAEHFEELLGKIGGYGKYQRITSFMLALVTIPCAFHNMGMVFLALEPQHHCKINLTSDMSLNDSIPWEDEGNLQRSKCLMFVSAGDDAHVLENGANGSVSYDVVTGVENSSTSWITKRTTKSCDSWEYDHSVFTSSIVSKWNLVCDRKWLVALAQSLYMFGFFMGCIVFGDISDRFGRKNAFLLTTVIQCVFGTAATFSPNLPLFIFLRFVVGMATGGQRNAAFTLGQELVVPEWRAFVGSLIELFWAVGYVMLGGIAYFARDWFILNLVISAPMSLFLIYYWFIPNSPRWLLAKGRVKEAEDILVRISKVNGRPLPDDFHIAQEYIFTEKDQQESRIRDLVRTPNIRKTTLIVWLNWFVVSMNFFGLAYSAGTLGGDIFINNTFLGGCEIFTLVLMPLAFRMGRRWPFAIFSTLGGLFCIVVVAFPKDMIAATVTLSALGKMAAAAEFLVAYVYSTEVYPTVIRTLGLGVASMWARAGAMVAPFVLLLGGVIPYVIFGLSGAIAGIISLMLPETYGRPLCDTVEIAEEVNKLQPWSAMFKCVWKVPEEENEKEANGVKMRFLDHDKESLA